MEIPGQDETTMNVISFAGRKVETLEGRRMIRRGGYEKVTLWSARLPEHLTGMIFLRTRRFQDCGGDVAREIRETIENFPLARMMNWGMHICTVLVAIRHA